MEPTMPSMLCPTCPGPNRCPIAEAEDCLSEICRDKIRKELTDLRWMLSLGNDGLEKPDQIAMAGLLSKLQRVLVNGSHGELFSVARQIAESKELQSALQ
jgi:hypothetical protein